MKNRTAVLACLSGSWRRPLAIKGRRRRARIAVAQGARKVNGSLGCIVGAYGMQRGEPDSGKFTLTLRKAVDGRWLFDMDNSGSRR